ncbi:MAG: AraC family transcriptional regulator [Clostridia bacterium]|nr:AraC family transcriptional regulator [Clostridia bacterium]
MRIRTLIEDKGFSDFSPCDFGQERCEPSHKFGPHIRSYYLIHFVTAGSGTFTSPRGTFSVRAGEAFIIRRGEVTVYEADKDTPWSYTWLGFTGSLSSRFEELPDVVEYDSGFINELSWAFELDVGCEEYLTGMIFKLYAYLFGSRIKVDHPNKVHAFINAHYMEDISIAKIADSLGLDRKYLARIYKEKFGITMQQQLIDKRLHEAKKLLLRGHGVEESAYMVGYSDYFGFSKAFKRKYGDSPINFKRDK